MQVQGIRVSRAATLVTMKKMTAEHQTLIPFKMRNIKFESTNNTRSQSLINVEVGEERDITKRIATVEAIFTTLTATILNKFTTHSPIKLNRAIANSSITFLSQVHIKVHHKERPGNITKEKHKMCFHIGSLCLSAKMHPERCQQSRENFSHRQKKVNFSLKFKISLSYY
jgi:hypothetical protein